MTEYKVFRCYRCGKIATSSAKVPKCIYCNGKQSKRSRILKTFDHPNDAVNYCKVAKDQIEGKGVMTNTGLYKGSETNEDNQ